MDASLENGSGFSIGRGVPDRLGCRVELVLDNCGMDLAGDAARLTSLRTFSTGLGVF